MDYTREEVQANIESALTGWGANTELTPEQFLAKLETLHTSLDALAYTVNPNSPCHPSTPR